MGWPSVQKYANGNDVTADVMNKPIGQLAERTDYLLNLIKANDHTKVVVDAVTAEPPGTSGIGYPKLGQPVYRIPGSSAYAKAASVVSENEWFYADPKAMAVGVVGYSDAQNDTSAKVVLYGFIDFQQGGSHGIKASSVIVDKNPKSGRYYLSPAYGMLTSDPGGPVIYVCDCHVEYDSTEKDFMLRSMLVNPQYRDTGESHIHRSFVVSGVPQGGYAKKGSSVYEIPANIWPDGEAPSSGNTAPDVSLGICGAWVEDRSVKYVIRLSGSGSAWGGYRVSWTAEGDVSGTSDAISMEDGKTDSSPISVGSYGMMVTVRRKTTSVGPSSSAGKSWTLNMPDSGRGWQFVRVETSGDAVYRLDLGFYPVMSRFVPPLPENGASLTIDESEPRGPVFGSRRQWWVSGAGADGGPWLMWSGGKVNGVGKTAPFVWTSDTAKATARDISLHVNRMRVGPTGFVTSLQAAKGSPVRVTSALTGEDAEQGALQVGLDVDFTTTDSDVSGHQVVKSIEGSTFKTGPVVERIVAGPGLSVMPDGGQGTVTVSVSNAVYSGDFETIALKNAKQDLAGAIFPYTKLLKWEGAPSVNIDSGFTAKFRVPDHIQYREGGYKVIVSASVFGEADASSSAVASFRIKNYVLADHACSLSMPKSGIPEYVGRISAPQEGVSSAIGVSFASGYKSYDPVLIHGFPVSQVPDLVQRQHKDDLLLRYVENRVTKDVIVYPGYFVGLSIDRCDVVGDGTWYQAPIGFLSLRWNLVEA